MTSTRSRLAASLTLACLALAWSGPSRAQDPAGSKDEGLDKLLEKLDEKAKPAPDPDKAKGDQPKPPGESKGEGPDKRDPKAKPEGDPSKPAEKLAPKDEGLDKLLEGLGQAKDEPAPDDKKPGGQGGEPDDKPKPDQAKPDPLGGAEKNLDKRLEELTGRKPKKKDGGDSQDGEGSGPLGDIIKEMREVEQRLGKPDTGAETRKKQTEIVKNLDSLIEQMKNSPSRSQGMKMIREAGKKPGPPQQGQPGNQPGATASGTSMSKPEKPKTPPVLTDAAKDLWGQLPSQFRDDMANVLNENPLPTKTDLIRLYFLSLGKKNSSRGE